jgi:hypothetical protein
MNMQAGKNISAIATRREAIAGLTFGLVAAAVGGVGTRTEAAEEIARTMESIHQEVQFKASP